MNTKNEAFALAFLLGFALCFGATGAVSDTVALKLDFSLTELLNAADSNENTAQVAGMYGLQLQGEKVKINALLADENSKLAFPEFEQSPDSNAPLLTGWLPINKLGQFADLNAVLFVAGAIDWNSLVNPEGFEETTTPQQKIDPYLQQLAESVGNGQDLNEILMWSGAQIENGKIKVLVYADKNANLKSCEIEELERQEQFDSLTITAWIPLKELKNAEKIEGLQYISIAFDYGAGFQGMELPGKLSFELQELANAKTDENIGRIIGDFKLDSKNGKVKVEMLLESDAVLEIEGFELLDENAVEGAKIAHGYIPITKLKELNENEKVLFAIGIQKTKGFEQPQSTLPPTPTAAETQKPTQTPLWVYPLLICIACIAGFLFLRWKRKRDYYKA
jgi:hypothetical protein